MSKKYVIGVIVLVVLLVVGFLGYKLYSRETRFKSEKVMESSKVPTVAMKKQEGSGGVKGTKLADNQMFSGHTYLIYPLTGEMPADTKTALTGWSVKITKNLDGSSLVSIVPDKTEWEDHKQDFTVQKGQMLYFVELNLQDDANGQDNMWVDDVGILTDANGVILNDLPKPPGGQKPPQQPAQ